jgi:glycosyltransferase involved in cell wall biosynthesis
MMIAPKCSVLMAVYRNDDVEHFLEAVRSVMAQTVLPNEVIIVIDGHVPEALQSRIDKLKSDYPGLFTIVPLTQNSGLAAALNVGLAACRNELVVRHDADDVSEPDRFEKQLRFLNNHPDVALISSWYDQYDLNMKDKKSVRPVPEVNADIVRFARHRTPINHACAVFRKSAVLAAGGYPRINGLCEDWWLALRLIKAGKPIYNLQESLVRVRGGDDFYIRRSGFNYLRQEVENLFAMRREGLMRARDIWTNLLIRIPSRLVPSRFLELFYQYGIRKLR